MTDVTAPNGGTIRRVELEIDPEPDASEREAITAALESGGAGEALPDAWRTAALREGVDDEPADP